MGFIIKEDVITKKEIAESFITAFELIGFANPKETTVITEMEKFWRQRKTLSRAQFDYLNGIVRNLRKKVWTLKRSARI
jgi:hypothetical protein